VPPLKGSRDAPVASPDVRIYTRRGDDGTTGLLYGGRVRKDDAAIELNGAVDEAQAALGVARAQAVRESELDSLLVELERDLWVLMAEVATAPQNRHKLLPGSSLVTGEMVDRLEARMDELSERFAMPAEFIVPGENPRSAALDLARTVVRRAERLAVGRLPAGESHAARYLNRLSDLVWVMARWQEGDEHLVARDGRTGGGTGGQGNVESGESEPS
jgi:cob(I)alamin adenosyltransferase